jgi:hypothetical protein
MLHKINVKYSGNVIGFEGYNNLYSFGLWFVGHYCDNEAQKFIARAAIFQ